MWLVVTKFNTFYIAKNAVFPKSWFISGFKGRKGQRKSGEGKYEKKWLGLKECVMISKNKRLFYNNVSVDMKYILGAWRKNVPKDISYSKLINIMRKKKWH